MFIQHFQTETETWLDAHSPFSPAQALHESTAMTHRHCYSTALDAASPSRVGKSNLSSLHSACTSHHCASPTFATCHGSQQIRALGLG